MESYNQMLRCNNCTKKLCSSEKFSFAVTPCKHFFCSSCIAKLIDSKSRELIACTVCRSRKKYRLISRENINKAPFTLAPPDMGKNPAEVEFRKLIRFENALQDGNTFALKMLGRNLKKAELSLLSAEKQLQKEIDSKKELIKENNSLREKR